MWILMKTAKSFAQFGLCRICDSKISSSLEHFEKSSFNSIGYFFFFFFFHFLKIIVRGWSF